MATILCCGTDKPRTKPAGESGASPAKHLHPAGFFPPFCINNNMKGLTKMNYRKNGFDMLKRPECDNTLTGTLIGGFVTGVAITLSLVGLFAKFNDRG